MGIGWQQLLIVLVVALLLFGGRGRISSIMGDMAKGIKSFRHGLKDDDEEETEANASKSDRQALDDEKTINVTPAKEAEKTKS